MTYLQASEHPANAEMNLCIRMIAQFFANLTVFVTLETSNKQSIQWIIDFRSFGILAFRIMSYT